MDNEVDFTMGNGDVVLSTEVNGIVDPRDLVMGEASSYSLALQHSNRSSPGLFVESSPEELRMMNSTHSVDLDVQKLDVLSTKAFPKVVIPTPRSRALPYTSLQSGLVYDNLMRRHAEPIRYNSDGEEIVDDDIHPEDPRRIKAIYDTLVEAGLVASLGPEEPSHFQLCRIPTRRATRAEICLVHSEDHYRWVESLANKSQDELYDIAKEQDSLYCNELTFSCATLAAGGAIEACLAVMKGIVKNAIAVIRPPGHHAEVDGAMGFCFFDNVAIAARVCQKKYQEACRKILILDWDVHHGNGVQEVFYDDPNVLYISLHRHENGTFYPSRLDRPDADHLHCGEGHGLGRNVNIPWSKKGMGDDDYIFAFQQVVMPIAQEFDPDLVIVAAGFDAADGDTLGECYVSPACYGHMTHMLMSLAKGKVAACLEGGYNLRSISNSALAVTKALMGEPPDRLNLTQPSPSAIKDIHLVVRQQAKFWKCIHPKNLGLNEELTIPTERMHDVVRSYQSRMMWEKHKMTPLVVLNSTLSKAFTNQVLATPNYQETRPLLVIFHDPPKPLGHPDPLTNEIELHNIQLADVIKTYVEWAVDQKFAVIDVNIPKRLTAFEDVEGYIVADDSEIRASATRALASYLWVNYINLSSATHVFLMGIGDAYEGLVDLLINEDEPWERVTNIIFFVADYPVRAVFRSTDDTTATLYYERSLIFVASNHAAWDQDTKRKRRRKYGRLVQSGRTKINSMLQEHCEEVFQLLLERTKDWQLEHERRNKATESDTIDIIHDSSEPAKPQRPSRKNKEATDMSRRPPALDHSKTLERAEIKTPPPMGLFTTASSWFTRGPSKQ